MGEKSVCVVGAGSSGLTVVKTLAERGIAFDCFEKGSGVGGLWRYENDSGLSVAYRSLHINTSRRRTSFADLPMPEDYPDFPHHSLMLKYFEDYADCFGLREKVTFQTSVERVEPKEGGGFLVVTKDKSGQRATRSYSAVLIANGHHWSPRLPSIRGTCTSHALHSSKYRTPEPTAGKRVLIVGIGNSACDIACECARVAQRVFLSTRRGAHVIPKYMFGRPLDQLVPRWIWTYTPLRLFQSAFESALRISRGRLSRFGLPEPEHRILEEHPTISSDLLNLIGHGDIAVKPSIREWRGDHVLFDDGSQEQIDVVIYATGYNISVPFLDPHILNTENNQVRLYRLVVHPDYPGLYFIGLVQPWGSIMRLAEEQGRWVADLLQGKCSLPTPEVMKADIESEQTRLHRRYVQSARHTIQVDFYPYLTQLKRERRRQPGSTVRPRRIVSRPFPRAALGSRAA
jgi:cation diffusion facilitator CzcD-associated flavoprotein CzcO